MPLALKNITSHVPWSGRFRSLIIVIWDLFEIWCLIFGFHHRVARIIKLTPESSMKLHSKFVWERFATAIKIDRIPLFDVHLFLLLIKLAASQASGWAACPA
jgi:hypothetical protein